MTRSKSNKKNTLNTYKKSKTLENVIQLRKLRAQAKFLTKKTRGKNLQLASIPKLTHSRYGKKIHSLKVLNRNQEIHISDAQGTILSPEDVAEKIGTYFQAYFSNEIYKQEFINGIKTTSENSPIILTISPNNNDQIDLYSNITLNESKVVFDIPDQQ